MSVAVCNLIALGLFLIAYCALYNSTSVRLPSGVAIGFLCGSAPWVLRSILS